MNEDLTSRSYKAKFKLLKVLDSPKTKAVCKGNIRILMAVKVSSVNYSVFVGCLFVVKLLKGSRYLFGYFPWPMAQKKYPLNQA